MKTLTIMLAAKLLRAVMKSLFKRQGRAATMAQIREVADELETFQPRNSNGTGPVSLAIAVFMLGSVFLAASCSLRDFTGLLHGSGGTLPTVTSTTIPATTTTTTIKPPVVVTKDGAYNAIAIDLNGDGQMEKVPSFMFQFVSPNDKPYISPARHADSATWSLTFKDDTISLIVAEQTVGYFTIRRDITTLKAATLKIVLDGVPYSFTPRALAVDQYPVKPQ